VVVFDKVRENTAGLLATGRSSYSQAANTALNQTLVRSINTSLIALLPVTAILVVAIALLGTGELQDLALVLFVGMLSGTYSSIFIATPVLADLKEREPQYKQLARRVALRESGGRAAQRARAKAGKAGAARAAVADGADEGAGALDMEEDSEPAAGLVADAAAGSQGEQYDEAAVDDTAGAGSGEPVPAGRTASGGGEAPRAAPGARPGPRQQPRRTSSARRRPAGKKKRR
jgi:preprotein translocase subunit SecF